MARIAHYRVEVDHAIVRSAATDKLVHGLTLCFALRTEVSGSFERSQRAAHDFESLLMRPCDHLQMSGDDFVGAHGLRSPPGLGHRGQAADIPDVVDAQQNGHVTHARLREHVAVESRQRVRTDEVVQHAVSRDAFVHDAQFHVMLRQPLRQQVWPAMVCVWSRARSIGDGVTKSDVPGRRADCTRPPRCGRPADPPRR